MKVEIQISGMSCGMCVKRVEKALLGVEDVQSVMVDLTTGTAVVECSETTSKDLLKKVVEDSGYEVQ